MKSTMKKTLVAASLALAMGAVAPASAEVSVAATGQGDLLITPLYAATGGWGTQLEVINSSTTDSVVAKLVVRSQINSQELLDVLLYLSPGDMWRGDIVTNDTGRWLTSTDDSIQQANNANFATSTAPANYPIQDAASGDTADVGYVEIVEAWSANVGAAPVAKSTVQAAYIAAQGTGAALTAADTINTLSGTVRLYNSLNGVNMAKTMDTFADYDNLQYLNVGQETFIGENCGAAAGSTFTSCAQALEAHMSKDNLVVPYTNNDGDASTGTFGVVSFPTKNTTRAVSLSSYTPFPGGVCGVTYTVRDMMEGTPSTPTSGPQNYSPAPAATAPTVNCLPAEVNFFSASTLAGGFATDGWVNVDLPNNSVAYTGAPALASYLTYYNLGSGLSGVWMDAAHN